MPLIRLDEEFYLCQQQHDPLRLVGMQTEGEIDNLSVRDRFHRLPPIFRMTEVFK